MVKWEENYCTWDELNKVKSLKNKFIEDVMLPKERSKSILINECPWCEYEWKCYENSRNNPNRRMCLNRSTEMKRVWLYASDKRPKIEIGNIYGMLEVIKFDHKDKKGNLYYSCKCQCGRKVVVRSSNLLSGNTTSCGCLSGKRNKMQRSSGDVVYKCRKDGSIDPEIDDLLEWFGKGCKVGSMMNPDHTRHVFATEHHSKVGCKVDTLVTVEDKEAPENTYYYYDDSRCEFCGGLIRINNRAEQECEDCHVVV
jgi:hypothetical protein